MHDEVLTKEAKAILHALAGFKDFYLVGGTALALQIGHRRSVDFDLFSPEPLSRHLLNKAKRTSPGKSAVVTYRSMEQLNLILGGVKVTFLYFNYPVAEPLLQYKGMNIASVREIAALKAFAIGKRLSYKDYVDWYFMLKEGHVNIDNVIALAMTKFGNDFNDRLFLGQLVSIDDVTVQSIDFLRENVSKEQIASFLGEKVKEIGL